MAHSRLVDLIELAEETSSEKRRVLLREVTDLFFGTEAPSPGELQQFDLVLSQLAAEMEVAVRAELSARFAETPSAPLRLISALAMDEAIDVAAPVLAGCNALSEQDLLDVVKTRGQAHLRAVSRRKVVSEAVSDVIVERGDDGTLKVLLGNDGAQLSREAAEAAVDRAQNNPDLHEAVIERRSLPIDLLNEMYFVAAGRLRQRILEQNANTDPALLEQALAAGRKQVAQKDGALPADYDEAEAYVSELRAAGELTPRVLASFLRSGSKTQFLIALAQLADIDFHTARTIVEKKELDALAVVCKAANLDQALFLTYAVVLLNSEAEAMGRAQEYGRLYKELSRDTALRTLRFWKLRRQKSDMAA